MPPVIPLSTQRLNRIDLLRAAAMLWMTVYHFCFDLDYFGLIHQAFLSDPFWTTQRTLIVSLFLLCAGAPGMRFALPNARIMMHQPSSGIGGTATDIKIQAEQIGFTKRKMAELIAHHTGQTIETITADSDRDRWFTADEAKEYGFVDHVVRSAGQVSGSGGTAQ